MKKTIFCLLLAVGAAHAEISFVKPMTENECRQVLRDAADMYYDSRYCETESNEQTRQHAIIAWYALGELNSRISNEAFNRCPDLRLRGAEKDAFLAPYPKSHDAAETARFCTPGNRPALPRFTHATSRCSKSWNRCAGNAERPSEYRMAFISVTPIPAFR